ncbi:hypothetical protein [Morganella morganii]|uniref:hypothetical protein n=1 Tax=Morganella morganii TaxID=582 RepID=UPI0032DAB226
MTPAANNSSVQAVPDAMLLRQMPILKNPRYFSIYQSGRDRCLSLALSGEGISLVPLYSHNKTYQFLFSQGWRSVNAQDIRLASAGVCHVRHS